MSGGPPVGRHGRGVLGDGESSEEELIPFENEERRPPRDYDTDDSDPEIIQDEEPEPIIPLRRGRRRIISRSPSPMVIEGGAGLNVSQYESESDGEDLFGNDLERDYRPIPGQDRYDPEMLDDSSASDITIGGRRAAEEELRRRDRAEGRTRIMRKGLLYEDDEDDLMPTAARKRRFRDDSESGPDGSEGKAEEMRFESIEKLEDTRGMSIIEWVSMPGTMREIENRFKNFIKTFTEEGTGALLYRDKIKRMCEENKISLEVCYHHLANSQQVLAYFLPEAPEKLLELMDEALKSFVYSMYKHYDRVTKVLHVRIINLPLVEHLRSLREQHLNQLERVTGVISSATGVLPQLKLAWYECIPCGNNVILVQTQQEESRPKTCVECQTSNQFILNMETTVFQNYQRLKIQESPGKIPAGRLPRSKDVICLADLPDSCKPGDEVDLTGIYTHIYDGSLNVKQGFPVFSTVIIANYILRKDDKLSLKSHTDADVNVIRKLSKDNRIFDRIVASMAPSIFGHENIKRSIALSLFGGVRKNPGDKHQIRGDINILLCGDPGTAKSQFLKYVEKTASRTVYTTGQGASSVGLTAYVQRSPVTKEWTLEAGALVLADGGVCCIDEFDKMSDADRTSIHEAMEQQSISISKAGIVTSLKARCAIIAAANPIGGQYDPSLTFADNVTLTDPVLSRFDVLCVVRDIPDAEEDERLARFVINSHIRHHPHFSITDADEDDDDDDDDVHVSESSMISRMGRKENDADEMEVEDNLSKVEKLPQELLRKYLAYAKLNCQPKIKNSNLDSNRVASLYTELRRESMNTGSFPITVRHIESIIRMAEAHAKIHLREYVNDDDINMALRIVLETFIDTQKFSVLRPMEKQFQKYLTYKKDNDELLLFVLKGMMAEQFKYLESRYRAIPDYVEINEKDFVEKAKGLNIHSVHAFYESQPFKRDKFTFDKKKKVISQKRLLH